jgi:hypothetical protein
MAGSSSTQTAMPTTLGGLTGNLTSNTWQSTASDSLAVKDVYTGVDGKSVLTSVQNLFNDIGLNLSDVMRGGKWVAAQIPLITSLVKQGEAVLSQKGLMARVMSASGLVTGALSKLSAGATDGILGEVKDFGQVYAKFNGVIQRVASTNLSDMNAVGGLINSWTGQNGLFAADDQDGAVGFVTGLIHDCTSYGIPNSFGSLVSKLENTSLVSQVANRVLPSVIGASDIGSLSSMAVKLGDKAINSLNPSVISSFSSAFSMPAGSTTSDNTSTFATLFGTYAQVDSTWNTGTRSTSAGSVSTVNLASIMNGSSDFNTVLNQGAMSSAAPTDGSVNPQLYQLATKVSTPDVVSSLMQQFPTTLYTPNTISSQASTAADTVGSNSALAAVTQSAAQNHTLLGHMADGTPVYSDDEYRATGVFFPLSQQELLAQTTIQ